MEDSKLRTAIRKTRNVSSVNWKSNERREKFISLKNFLTTSSNFHTSFKHNRVYGQWCMVIEQLLCEARDCLRDGKQRKLFDHILRFDVDAINKRIVGGLNVVKDGWVGCLRFLSGKLMDYWLRKPSEVNL